MRHLIIDTDTASDDAVAIMMALAEPTVVVDAITTQGARVRRLPGALGAKERTR